MPGLSVFAALSMPLMIGFTAFAVDIGSVTLDSRRLQGVADAAALAAANDPAHAQAGARAAVYASGWSRPIDVTARTGTYASDAAVPVASRFVAAPAAIDAVRVTTVVTSPTFFGRIFGQGGVAITRQATAVRERFASLSIGTRLAAVQGGVVNAYLSALTGSSVSLSAAGYDALAGADVDLFGYLDAFHTTANLSGADFNHLVAANVTQAQALSALASALDAGGRGTAASAIRTLAGQVTPSRSLALSALVDPGPYGGQAGGGTGVARVNALALVTTMLQLASPTRQVSFDAGASTGLASTRLTVAIGERPAQSPWIAIARNGTPIVRTAQARVYAETTLLPAPLPGLSGLLSVKLPVFVELASGEARLTAIDCATAGGRGVSVEARPSPGQAAIATVDTARLSDFTKPVPLSSARVVDTLLVDVDADARLDLGATEPWQPLRFTAAQIAAGTPQTVSSSTAVSGVAASLASHTTLTPRVLGLPIPVAPLLGAVTTQLAAVAPAIDSLLDVATGALGVHYGQADVRVTGMRCGVAALVA